MKVMIATGGTGGHIYPALALAQVLKEKHPEADIVFFGSTNRMEANVIPKAGYRFYGAKMTGMTSGVQAKILSALSLVRAQRLCRKLMIQEKPDICVGFGNYISVPFINAAHALGIPTILHEQNSFAGKANKFLARKTDLIIGCYESNLEQFPAGKCRLLGNPEATLAAKTEWDPEELVKIGLQEDRPFVVFMMGSLGSSSVSKVIDEACPLFDPSYQVVIAAGQSNEYTYKTPSDERIRIVPYIDGKKMLKGCALAVTRAGATTMCEISAIGCASVLIPSAFVANNHQVYNALELVKAEAAVMIEEKDLHPQKLADTVNALMKDPERLAQMRANAAAAGRPDAAYRMIECMEELIRNG